MDENIGFSFEGYTYLLCLRSRIGPWLTGSLGGAGAALELLQTSNPITNLAYNIFSLISPANGRGMVGQAGKPLVLTHCIMIKEKNTGFFLHELTQKGPRAPGARPGDMHLHACLFGPRGKAAFMPIGGWVLYC